MEKCAQETHEPWYESVAGPFEDVEESGEERRADDEAQPPALEQIDDEKGRCGLVETVLLLQHECLIYREWESRDRRDEEEDDSERDGLHNLPKRLK
jgi:hypothetical protein